ncbi:MAG TPA: DUF5996 family protein [Terriglobales bacterium]|jgi:hypothetical protein
MSHFADNPAAWPELPLKGWQDTCATLHMWTQIVGKVRLALAPPTNHWWQVPLYVCETGLTTSTIPCHSGVFEIRFDFAHHNLVIQTSAGPSRVIPLRPQSVAAFYKEFISTLSSLGIEPKIWTMPVEVPNPIPFEKDTQHASYDRDSVNRFWRALLVIELVFQEFRSRFVGKNSPVHFFWGSFDLAVTRFSGKRAPEREGADRITREAYSHEVISAGWWPGGGDIPDAAFYCYAAPEPTGLSESKILPKEAYYHTNMKGFLLMYDEVRRAPSPRTTLLDFMQSTYEVAANLGKWDRDALERSTQEAA